MYSYEDTYCVSYGTIPYLDLPIHTCVDMVVLLDLPMHGHTYNNTSYAGNPRKVWYHTVPIDNYKVIIHY